MRFIAIKTACQLSTVAMIGVRRTWRYESNGYLFSHSNRYDKSDCGRSGDTADQSIARTASPYPRWWSTSNRRYS